MKKLHRIVLLSCAALPFLGQAQTAQVHIAGSAYPVLFADTNLTSKVKQRIADDLTIAFSPAPSFERAMGGDEVEATTPLPGGDTAVTSFIGRDYWEGAFGPSRNHSMLCFDEIREGIYLVDYNGQKSVRIDKVASSNYLHTFALMKAHSNAVAKAHEFVEALKNPNLASEPLQVLKDMHHALPLKETDDDTYRGFARETQKCKNLELCALNFSLQMCPELSDQKVLVAVQFSLYQSDPSKLHGFPIIFHNGRWGFGKYW
ncbi:MAG: hypothetical protein FWG50_00760 [Kiritimatiellaeota bacterium]|nr:hypothetical protein [Kiritimatiellota bacterium]